MFATISRSWEFAKMSYRLLWQHKRLMVFPVLSSVAAIAVTASFVLPLWQTGTLAEWSAFMEEGSAAEADPMMYLAVFLFYFCNYFTIVFFNTALVGCVLGIMRGEEASVGDGLSLAARRIPQIFGWSLLSAVVGVILKAIENSNRRAGAFVSAILGSAWTALAYFVVPVIVVDGVGPIEAFKRSTKTLTKTWGTALVGNFSLGVFAFLLMLPVFVLLFAAFGFAGAQESAVAAVAAIAIGVPLILIVAAATSTADMIFKVFLFTYATGRTLPADVDTSQFAGAFRPRGEK